MKTRYWALIAVIAILLGLLLWWSRARPKVASDPVKPSTAIGQSKPDIADKDALPPEPLSAPATTPLPQRPLTKGEQAQAILQAYNHKDIEFYGKVIDQFGAPLPGVQVNGQVIYNSGVSSGVLKPRTSTDANGYFEIKGVQGRTLGFNLIKDGYQFMPEGDAFDYTEFVPEGKRHHPDPKNPVVLKMWKLQGAEPMVHMRKDFKIPPDGTPVRIDLTTGKKVEQGGDLVLTLRHEAWAPGVQGKRPFDWTMQLEANNGGVVESTQRLMYLAPEDSYAPSLTIDMPSAKSGWEPDVSRTFYLKSRGQIYSRVGMVFNANPNQERGSYLSLNWWLNPKPGSRNLEFDPAKVIKPQP